MTARFALLAAVAVVLAAGCGSGERDAGEPPVEPGATPAPPHVSPDGPVTVPLEDTAGLGLSGKVTLASPGPERTDVGVELEGAEGAAFSASIRDGSCAEPGGVVHDLGVVERGTSHLAAEAPLQGVLSQDRAFVLTAAEAEGVVACAELPRRAG